MCTEWDTVGWGQIVETWFLIHLTKHRIFLPAHFLRICETDLDNKWPAL